MAARKPFKRRQTPARRYVPAGYAGMDYKRAFRKRVAFLMQTHSNLSREAAEKAAHRILKNWRWKKSA